MKLTKDLKFIESAIEMTASALLEKDGKLAEACIQSIQNYLNATHHPLGFFSTGSLLRDNNN